MRSAALLALVCAFGALLPRSARASCTSCSCPCANGGVRDGATCRCNCVEASSVTTPPPMAPRCSQFRHRTFLFFKKDHADSLQIGNGQCAKAERCVTACSYHAHVTVPTCGPRRDCGICHAGLGRRQLHRQHRQGAPPRARARVRRPRRSLAHPRAGSHTVTSPTVPVTPRHYMRFGRAQPPRACACGSLRDSLLHRRLRVRAAAMVRRTRGEVFVHEKFSQYTGRTRVPGGIVRRCSQEGGEAG